MNQSLIYLLESGVQRDIFENSINAFFAWISKYLYGFFSGTIDLIYKLASFDYGMDDYINYIQDKIFGILTVFMIFSLTISIMKYLVNPDIATDSSKGFQGIIKRVIISIVLLMSINPLFDFLTYAQNSIIDDDIITSLFLDTSDSSIIKYKNSSGQITLYGIRMSEECPQNKYTYAVSTGDRMALLLFRPFLQPDTNLRGTTAWGKVFGNNPEIAYCGVDIADSEEELKKLFSLGEITINDKEEIQNAIDGPNTVEAYSRRYYVNISTGEINDDPLNGKNGYGTMTEYFFDFNGIFSVICGFIALLITISFCFDVVIRSLTLILLKLIAPIPIISYISPDGKKSEMLKTWGQKIVSVWASLFIRLIVLTLGISLITSACKSISEQIKLANVSLIMQIFIILGILMFMKKLPKLIEELIPGLKLDGGFQLNPFKRVQNDAVGGKAITGALGRGLGLATGGIGGAIAGAKAGKEVGNIGVGTALGLLSGASTGFRNKKWSFGSGMNETYKNLTGNEFRRLTPTSMLLPKMGQKHVQETKDYVGRAYGQLNKLTSDLNISESMSASLAQSLSSKGYDINDIDSMRTKVKRNIIDAKSSLEPLKSKSETLEIDKNQATENYNNLNANYNKAINSHNLVKSTYEDSVNALNEVNRKILEEEKKLSSGSMIGSFAMQIEDKINVLKNQKVTLESTVSNNKIAVDNSQINLDRLKDELKTAEFNKNQSVEKYNNNNIQIEQLQQEIDSCQQDLTEIQKYEDNRKFEDKKRKEISDINKDIDTLKREKGQRERFYRIDPAPQQDYGDAKSHVDNR